MATVAPAVTSPGRLAALRRLAVLDGPPHTTFDRLTRLAAELLETPIALLTLVDADRQFFLSSSGLPEPIHSARETALDYSICQYAIGSRRPLIVSDARADPVLRGNRAVTELGVAAYAGVPLITGDGHAVGTLCVIDFVPRDWTDDRLAILARLADITMDEIRLHFLERVTARRRERHRPLASERPGAT
jgi:GAF domain-containing protein